MQDHACWKRKIFNVTFQQTNATNNNFAHRYFTSLHAILSKPRRAHGSSYWHNIVTHRIATKRSRDCGGRSNKRRLSGLPRHTDKKGLRVKAGSVQSRGGDWLSKRGPGPMTGLGSRLLMYRARLLGSRRPALCETSERPIYWRSSTREPSDSRISAAN